MGFQKLFPDHEEVDFDSSESVIIYTDGSCIRNGKSDAPCGWAYCIKSNQSEEVISNSGGWVGGTNNQAEMAAVYQALQASIRDLPTTVYSDSKYVVDTLNGKYTISKNQQYWSQLRKLVREFKNIRFLWVKGHSDNQYNNLVDELANREASIRSK